MKACTERGKFGSIALALGVVLLATGCVNAASTGAGADAALDAGPSPVASAPAKPPQGPDADVPGLQKLLGCTAGAGSGPCKVLATMTTCAVWNPVSPSGDGRYIGRGWLVRGGATTEQVTLLRAHSAPSTAADSWQLPIRVAIAQLPQDAGAAFAQSERAVNAFERHDVPPAKNAAIDYLKQRSDWNDSRAVRTTGSMVQTFSEQPAYICVGPQHELVVVQQPFGAVGKSADGLYAQLWPASW